MKYTEYNLDAFDQIPNVNGLYTWHLKHLDSITLEQYYSLLRHKRFSSNIKGVFNENYIGQLTLSKEIDLSSINPKTEEIIKDLTQHINSPIYIGISNNLNRRLAQHNKKLTSFLFDNTKISVSTEWDQKYEDTDDESAYFAERIGTVLKENKINAINVLFVRIYEFDIERSNLLIIEKFFNQCLLPIYGKR
jgi:predicted GIY-YIG superfamily endonuclease